MALKILKSQKGQSLVEFAICIVIYFLFIYGIMATSIWGITSFITQDIAHESARKYAVTDDMNKSAQLGQVYMKRWAYLFIDQSSVQISLAKDGTKTIATVVSQPKSSLKKLYIFSMPSITKTASATIEDYIRDPSAYMGGN